MDLLPNELITRVFTFASPVDLILVCKRWYDLACVVFPEIIVRKYAAKVPQLNVITTRDLMKKLTRLQNNLDNSAVILDIEHKADEITMTVYIDRTHISGDIILTPILTTSFSFTNNEYPASSIYHFMDAESVCRSIYGVIREYETTVFNDPNSKVCDKTVRTVYKIIKTIWKIARIKRKNENVKL